jgi:hypothetical protein
MFTFHCKTRYQSSKVSDDGALHCGKLFVSTFPSSRSGFITLWYVYHQWYASHCSVVHGLSKKKLKDKNKTYPFKFTLFIFLQWTQLHRKFKWALFLLSFFPVPVCAITASGVPGGTFVSMNCFSTLCGWLVQRQGWRVKGRIWSSEQARSARANSWLDYQRLLEK